MRAKVVRDDIQISPAFAHCCDSWAADLEWREILENGSMVKRPFWKIGTILDPKIHGPALSDCWMAVKCGWADPVDDECDAMSGRMSRERLDAAQRAYTRVAKGIHPEDAEAFDAGEILGYDPLTGDYIKGPNWKEPEPEKEDEEDE